MYTAQVRPARVSGLAAQSPERLRAPTTPIFSLIYLELEPHAYSKAEQARGLRRLELDLFWEPCAIIWDSDMTVQGK